MRSPFIFVGRFSLFLEGRSGLSLVAGFLFSLIGFAINISNAPSGMIICPALLFQPFNCAPGVKYVGTFFCVTGPYAAVPGIIAWCVHLHRQTFHVHIILRGPVNVGWGITSPGNTNVVWAWHFR
jgi:hypothetical protein